MKIENFVGLLTKSGKLLTFLHFLSLIFSFHDISQKQIVDVIYLITISLWHKIFFVIYLVLSKKLRNFAKSK